MDMTDQQIEGLTKARLVSNIERLTQGLPPFENDADYMAFVTTTAGLKEFPLGAADSYFEQWGHVSLEDLTGALTGALDAQAKAAELTSAAEQAQAAAADAGTEAQDVAAQARGLIAK